MKALKLVAYAATPWLLLGIANIYLPISLIAFLGGIYGLYILYLGIPIYMETPKEQQMPYFHYWSDFLHCCDGDHLVAQWICLDPIDFGVLIFAGVMVVATGTPN